MTGNTPVLVADFARSAQGQRPPDARALVEAAAEAGTDWLAVSLHATRDGWGVVHGTDDVELPDGTVHPLRSLDLSDARRAPLAGGRRICTLEEVLLDARRGGLGLLIRVEDGRALAPLAAGLGVVGGGGAAALRSRFLVAVRDRKLGRRLRVEVRDAPSARELLPGGGLRGRLQRRTPNLARAAADADDLIVPLGLMDRDHLADRLVPALARRGARLWLSDVPPDHRPEVGAHGLLLRMPAVPV